MSGVLGSRRHSGERRSCPSVVTVSGGEAQPVPWRSPGGLCTAPDSQGVAGERETHGERSMARNLEEKAKGTKG